MKGEEVKELLKKSGYSLNEIAETMGETPQNLQSMLRASDIKTGVLERIAKAINSSLYFFFEDSHPNNTVTGNNNTAVAGNGNKINSKNADVDKFLSEIAEQRKLTIKAQEQIDRLLTLLENK